MVELDRIDTAIVAAHFALASLIFDCHLPDFLSPRMDGPNKVLAPIAVFSFLTTRHLPSPSSRRHYVPSLALGTSCLVHSQMLYRLSYRGIRI